MAVFAYLDPNSGSMLVGAIAAAGAGVAVAAKVGWRRVAGVLGPKRRSDDPETPAAPETGPLTSTADDA